MPPFPIQTLILIAAGVALFRLWRASQPSERWLQLVVAAGFLSRAILGQILFWISWGRLPIARGLQLGNGLWFFAPDASDYFHTALATADKGLWAIVTFDHAWPSATYVQTLALSVWLFGRTTSVGVLLNLFCYLGAIALIVRWTAKEPRVRTAAALAIVALSFSPALVLWSLQPLKDTFFQFVFVAFVASCAAWQRAWIGRGRWTAWIAASALLTVLLYAAAAIRWYFALVLLITASLFLVITAIRSAGRRLPAIAAAVVVAFVLSRSFVAGAGPQLSPQIREAFTPGAFAAAMKLPATLLGSVEQARVGFNGSGGGTQIHVGKRMAASEPKPPLPVPMTATTATAAAPPSPARIAKKKEPATTDFATAHAIPLEKMAVAPRAPSLSPADEEQIRALLDTQVAAWNRGDLKAYLAPYWRSPELEISTPTTSLRGWDATREFYRTNAGRPMGNLELRTDHVGRQEENKASVSGRWKLTGQKTTTGTFSLLLRRFDSDWKVVSAVTSQPADEIASPPVKPSPAKKTTSSAIRAVPPTTQTLAIAPAPIVAPPPPVIPQETAKPAPIEPSFITRLLSGVGVMVLPRAVGERLGVFHVGGGRGLFWFADIDTLAFDLLLFCVVAAMAMRLRTAWRNPLAWLAFTITLLLAGPLAYSVTNFGTLFRLREMIYIGLLLTPLAAAASGDARIASA
jgi:beta-aspartyl-peptidase (threonine type)